MRKFGMRSFILLQVLFFPFCNFNSDNRKEFSFNLITENLVGMRQKLNLITLGVDNFERSLNFFEKGLGWKKSDKSMDDLALFPLGGIMLALYPREELANDATLTY
jgi:hypothetical protein